jgi:hypothetical protein
MTRHGQIARLPLSIRQQLNQRLQNGKLAQDLLSCLNRLPEVQAIRGAHFAAKPIDQSNPTHWKQGGYLDKETTAHPANHGYRRGGQPRGQPPPRACLPPQPKPN